MNRLQFETSPYLLQHKHNPVDWYPWGEEALHKAKDENKIILVSIGYSACHWCHVMERESFENEATAKLMNDFFINIKIDREERPDLDHIYMDALQTLTGSGGWPLNMFLTPDAKPFYGGTYFPPVKAYNRASWPDILYGVHEAWKQRSHEILAQAEELTEHLKKANGIGNMAIKINADENPFTKEQCHTIFENCMKQADEVWGGYGQAPKFPQTFTTSLLMQYYYFTQNEKALKQALLTLDKMIAGGIHDQVGGGFARYSTDTEWLAPHFEKMLYDNALLLCNLADAFSLTKNPHYEAVIKKTIEFLQREMLDKSGGYYAAIDADSEGVEGKFYVWQKEEVEKILGNDADVFCKYYDITEKGNWEETNILRTLNSPESFAVQNHLTIQQLNHLTQTCLQKLLVERNKRIRPQTDDKILLGWNALLITALCKCAASLASKEFEAMAISCWNFLMDNLSFNKNEGSFYHTYKDGQAKYPAFLDDYAYLMQAAIHLQEITSDTGYLLQAKKILQHVLDNFSDENQRFFYFTGKEQTDVIVKKIEIYDGATPSGNAVMAENLLYLGTVFNISGWIERAILMLQSLEGTVVKYPGSFGIWASLLLNQVAEIEEVSIIGVDFQSFKNQLLMHYFPNKVFQTAVEENKGFPLLNDKGNKTNTLIYSCKNYSCMQPYHSVPALLKYLQNANKF